MSLYRYMNCSPDIAAGVYMAPGSAVIGKAFLGENVSVWFNSVIRADEGEIRIGEGTNIQDLCVLHTDEGHCLSIGKNVTVGHRCVIHGCIIEDNCLIGMGAIIMNGARIGTGSVIAAGSVVLENIVIPPFSLAAGVPATVKKTLPPESTGMVGHASGIYRMLASNYRDQCSKT